MAKQEGRGSYPNARIELIIEAASTKIYGVRLDGDGSPEGYFPIWFCGMAGGGREVRLPTKRIWHLPADEIASGGVVKDFTYEGQAVEYFVIRPGTMPIEEHYSNVSLEDDARSGVTTLERRADGAGGGSELDCFLEWQSCVSACANQKLHPPEMGWTRDSVQGCLDSCRTSFERCQERKRPSPGGFGLLI